MMETTSRKSIDEVQAEILEAERLIRKLTRLGDDLALNRTPDTVAAWREASVDARMRLAGISPPRRPRPIEPVDG